MRKYKTWHLNNRALSPIFATILLAVIVIVIGSIAFYFSNNITKTASDQYSGTLSDSQRAISERLSFENVNYTSSSLDIYLINCGAASSVQVNSIFIYDGNHNIVGSPYSDSSQISPFYQIDGAPFTPIYGNQLNIGQEGHFIVNLSGTLANGTIYDIHLITKGGSSYDYQFTL